MPQTIPAKCANPLDKFYTRPATAAACLAHLRAVLPDLEADLYLEPAAGDGVFLYQLPEPRLGMDIEPGGPGMKTADFLSWRPDQTLKHIVVVGNPPFGCNAALAVRFFNRAAEYAEVIAMIMPASMMKGSMQDRLDTRFHLLSEKPLPGEMFRVGEALHRVNAVFQVWQHKESRRARTSSRTTHADFDFVSTPAGADFAMRRVGGRAGDILPLRIGAGVGRGYAPASNLFIKAKGVNPELLEKRFRTMDFSDVRQCVAANPSVSKREIVALYEALIALEAVAETARPKLCIQTCISKETDDVATYLPPPFTAVNGEIVAMIFRHQSSATEGGARPELVEFRWCQNGVFRPVLRTCLRGKTRRQADLLLADLFAGLEPWSNVTAPCDQTSVVFRDGVLRLQRLPDGRKLLHLELRDTGDCDAVLFAREQDYYELGRAWLVERGELDPLAAKAEGPASSRRDCIAV